MKSLVRAIEFDHLVRRLGHVSDDEKLVSAYEAVRDIPYDGTGKHSLLKSMFESLGFEVRAYLARHDLGALSLHPWPGALESFRGERTPSFHEFLKIRREGRWLTVDATFDHALARIGFPLLEWDGRTDMALPVRAEEIHEVAGDLGARWRALVAQLPPAERKRRQAFLKALKAWIEEERSVPARRPRR